MSSFLSTQPYKGTRDFYPEEMRIRRWMFDHFRQVVERFGYEEYGGPMLEPFEVYAAKSGEEIVNQQLYWLIDRGERKMAIRPEMTPTLARMVAGKIHELPRPIRWYSIPNLWRYERPQRGRLREHWQLNVDVLGGDRLLADAEIITIAVELMRAFGGGEWISVRVNHRGLMDQFFSEVLGSNSNVAQHIIKLIDARSKIGEEAYEKGLSQLGVLPDQKQKMEEFFQDSFEKTAAKYPCPAVDDLIQTFQLLNESGVGNQVVFDPTVMRGLDYYTGTVFEIFDVSPENRRALFGGGRYDNLIGLFGKEKLSGVGFGMGDVGVQNFLETHGLIRSPRSGVDALVALPKKEFRGIAEKIVSELRQKGLRVITPLEVSGFGAQLKMASRHQARFAVLLGDLEWADGQKVIVKNLERGTQEVLPLGEIASFISNHPRSSETPALMPGFVHNNEGRGF